MADAGPALGPGMRWGMRRGMRWGMRWVARPAARSMARSIAVVVMLLAWAACAVGWNGAPAARADDALRVTRLDITADVRRDGGVHVREIITYDFGRTGRAGMIWARGARDEHVVATLIDLAARGHLRIDEPASPGAPRRTGETPRWTLTAQDAPRDDLTGYERTLLTGLFAAGETLTFQELADDDSALQRAKDELAEDARDHRWLHSPRRVPRVGRSTLLALCAVAAAIVAMWPLHTAIAMGPRYLGAGQPPFAVMAAGFTTALICVVAAVLAWHAEPRWTRPGRRLLRRLAGHRRHLGGLKSPPAGDAGRIAAHLPYAITLGTWSYPMTAVGREGTPVPWFTGTSGVPAFARDLLGRDRYRSPGSAPPGRAGSSRSSGSSTGAGGR
jgi:hypothetical protein